MKSNRSSRVFGSKRLRFAGGYRQTISFQTATLTYGATDRFCDKFLEPRPRWVGQMVLVALSGRQNITEASRSAAASSQTKLRFLNVARAILEEPLFDFDEFLHHRLLPQWATDLLRRSPSARCPRDSKKVRPIGQLCIVE